MKLKDTSPWKESYGQSRQHIKSRDTGSYSQSYGFFSSQVRMWKLDYKEGWVLKNCHFWIVVLRKILQSLLDQRRSSQSILKEIKPEYSLDGLMLKLKLQYFGHLMRTADSLEKTMMLGKIEGQEEKQVTENEMAGQYQLINAHEFEQTLWDSKGQGSLACCSPRGCKESDMIYWLNNKVVSNYLLIPWMQIMYLSEVDSVLTDLKFTI